MPLTGTRASPHRPYPPTGSEAPRRTSSTRRKLIPRAGSLLDAASHAQSKIRRFGRASDLAGRIGRAMASFHADGFTFTSGQSRRRRQSEQAQAANAFRRLDGYNGASVVRADLGDRCRPEVAARVSSRLPQQPEIGRTGPAIVATRVVSLLDQPSVACADTLCRAHRGHGNLSCSRACARSGAAGGASAWTEFSSSAGPGGASWPSRTLLIASPAPR